MAKSERQRSKPGRGTTSEGEVARLPKEILKFIIYQWGEVTWLEDKNTDVVTTPVNEMLEKCGVRNYI